MRLPAGRQACSEEAASACFTLYGCSMLADLIQRLKDHFDARSKREKLILLAGGVSVAGFLLYSLFQLPFAYMDRMETLDRLILQKEDGLKQLAELSAEYRKLNDRVGRIESRI